MKRRNAFTIVEVLVVVSILAVIAGLLLPVFASAKKAAQETRCMGNLHQLQLALLQYRSSNNGDGKFGPGDQMGLPPRTADDFALLGLPIEVYHCNAPPNLMGPRQAIYYWLFDDRAAGTVLDGDWADYVRKNEENSVIIADVNHGDRSLPIMSPYTPHRAIAVRLSGQVFRFTKVGDWGDYAFWPN